MRRPRRHTIGVALIDEDAILEHHETLTEGRLELAIDRRRRAISGLQLGAANVAQATGSTLTMPVSFATRADGANSRTRWNERRGYGASIQLSVVVEANRSMRIA